MSVTAAQGFRAAGVAAGLKTSGLLDVALVVNDGPQYAAAAVVTSNRVKAAPVLWTQQVLADGRADAVVLNSGGANACTGPAGFQDTHAIAEWAALALGVSATDVAVCSTGLIGQRLPVDRLLAGLEDAVHLLTETGGEDAARAIMTTDTVPKQSAAYRDDSLDRPDSLDGPDAGAEGSDGFVVGGMAKGAGMLAPGLATMLAVLTTDAVVPADTLDRALRAATAATFDRVDSDGCMSTNDTVLLLASGASGVAPDEVTLTETVTAVCADLARQMIDDAEGATKSVAVSVQHAATTDDALTVARAVARSNLVKCAAAGEDPNWGRILAAVGTTDARFEPERLAVAVNGVWVCRDGAAGEDRSLVDMRGRLVRITVDLGAGDAGATVWTTDLTTEYVAVNSEYPT